MEEKVKRKDLTNERNIYIYGFYQIKTMRIYGDHIYTGKINIDKAEIDQNILLENMVDFNDKSRPGTKGNKDKSEIFIKVHILFMRVKN